MPNIEYKVLFEVRILHDYYLYGLEPGDSKGVESPVQNKKSYFAMNAVHQRTRLAELLKNAEYDIRKDLSFLTSVNEEKLFRKLRMKLVRTATGFFLGVEVRRSTTNSGKACFRPTVLPSKETYINIGVVSINPLFRSISNLSLGWDTPNIYYFSNEGVHHGNSLSSPVRPIVSGKKYRMGDLALVAGSVRQAIVDNNGNLGKWRAIAGDGFIHQADCTLDPEEDWYCRWRSAAKMPVKNPIGMIRISLQSGYGEFSPINESGCLINTIRSTTQKMTHPVYELRLLSRSTYWRYCKRDGFLRSEKEGILSGAESYLQSEQGNIVTKYPQPITRERPPEINDLPYAQPGLIKTENGRIYSDIEFNALNPIPINH